MRLSSVSLLISRVALAVPLVFAISPAFGDARLRNQEIGQCSAADIATWGDGQDRTALARSFSFSYQHSGAPPWFREQQVLELLRNAAAEWSKCGIPSQVTVATAAQPAEPGMVIVYWDTSPTVGPFGLANLTAQRLSLGRQAFHLLRQRNPAHDATDTLQMVLSHEMGHFYGLVAHSRRCVDVLSYYHDGKGNQCFTHFPELLKSFPEYRSSLPTACDIQRCRSVNRLP